MPLSVRALVCVAALPLALAVGCGKQAAPVPNAGGGAQPGGAPAAAVAKNPEFKTTAEDLTKEAIANPDAFAAKYKGKVVEVEGAVDTASAALTENGFILLGSKKKPTDVISYNVFCVVPEGGDRAKAHQLGRGQKVKAVGRVADSNSLAIYLDGVTFTEAGPNPSPKATAEEVTAEFAKDMNAAKTKYGIGEIEMKEIYINGTVDDVVTEKTNFGERTAIVLAGSGGVKVKADLAAHKRLADGLKKGDKVTIKGEITHYDEGNKMVNMGAAYVGKQG